MATITENAAAVGLSNPLYHESSISLPRTNYSVTEFTDEDDNTNTTKHHSAQKPHKIRSESPKKLVRRRKTVIISSLKHVHFDPHLKKFSAASLTGQDDDTQFDRFGVVLNLDLMPDYLLRRVFEFLDNNKEFKALRKVNSHFETCIQSSWAWSNFILDGRDGDCGRVVHHLEFPLPRMLFDADLKSVVIRNIDIDERGVSRLVELLSLTKARKVQIQGLWNENASIYFSLGLPACSCSLRELDISYCNLGGVASALFEFLSENPRLQKLRLYQTFNPRHDHIDFLCEGLQRTHCLKELTYGGDDLDGETIYVILRAIHDHSHIKKLNLKFYGFADCTFELAQLVRMNKSLEHLTLNGPIDGEIGQIGDEIMRNRTLKTFKFRLAEKTVSEGDLEDFFDGFQRNKVCRKIGIANIDESLIT
eukprot:CAMPEP_0115009528 /NCGR_PEP_ID=MMETSP0216-20121206/22682_1 /TAXON_ID=223996 /ORGANISM="Protocruzia adherens, Strain Boccale" /LENGTH=420 /DNA_ID=CAMNT_0002377385 /DNA_START=238 /DNA_END=1496 /DNA_ORIENTATION=+